MGKRKASLQDFEQAKQKSRDMYTLSEDAGFAVRGVGIRLAKPGTTGLRGVSRFQAELGRPTS